MQLLLVLNVNAQLQYVTTFAGSTFGDTDGTGTAAKFGGPNALAITPDGATLFVGDSRNSPCFIRKVTGPTYHPAISEKQLLPAHAHTDFARSPELSLRAQVDMASRAVTTIASSSTGLGVGTCSGLAVSSDGGTLYVADQGNHRIRQVCSTTSA